MCLVQLLYMVSKYIPDSLLVNTYFLGDAYKRPSKRLLLDVSDQAIRCKPFLVYLRDGIWRCFAAFFTANPLPFNVELDSFPMDW